MKPTATTPFRLGDLPSELRCKIYRDILCDFTPRLRTNELEHVCQLQRVKHSIETAILRTNSTVYREAYDVMVKTNRFIKVTTSGGIPAGLLIQGIQLPLVATTRKIVERFQGYTLAVHLSAKTPIQPLHGRPTSIFYHPCSFMILSRELDMLSFALADGEAHLGGFNEALQIKLTMAPLLNVKRKRYSPAFNDFFSDKTQKALLQPFRNRLRGCNPVTINGHVNKHLARTAAKEMEQDQWTDPEKVVEEITAAKDKGSNLFRERNSVQAILVWEHAALTISKMLRSRSWPKLVQNGGETFVSQLANLHFIVQLNVAHIQITDMQHDPSDYAAGATAEEALQAAAFSLQEDYWMPGYRYRPPITLLAKMRYRMALCMRLQAHPGTGERALEQIDMALRLLPDDPVLLRERQNIVDAVVGPM